MSLSRPVSSCSRTLSTSVWRRAEALSPAGARSAGAATTSLGRTSDAGLSSRRRRKTGARRWPSSVHWANFTFHQLGANPGRWRLQGRRLAEGQRIDADRVQALSQVNERAVVEGAADVANVDQAAFVTVVAQ